MDSNGDTIAMLRFECETGARTVRYTRARETSTVRITIAVGMIGPSFGRAGMAFKTSSELCPLLMVVRIGRKDDGGMNGGKTT